MKQDVLAALKAGKSLSQIFGRIGHRKYGPCVVSSDTLKRLRKEDGAFDQEVEGMAKANGIANNIAGRNKCYANKAAATHCQRGHPITDANSIYFRKGYRQCRACKDMTDRSAGRPMTREQAAKVIEALREGKTYRAICHGIEGPNTSKRQPDLYIVRHQKLLAFRRANPRFDKQVESLAAKNRTAHFLEAMSKRRIVRAQVYESADDAMEVIRRAVPNTIGYARKQEVISEMALAYVEGRLNIRDIAKRVPEFMQILPAAWARAGSAPRLLICAAGAGSDFRHRDKIRDRSSVPTLTIRHPRALAGGPSRYWDMRA
jgi:hypothetical protein